jgi:hypothetical protein
MTAELAPSHVSTGPGVDDAAPIFVAGPDRSGTTLMFALLASHPDLSMVRRTNMWRYFHDRYGDLGRAGNLDRCLADMTSYRRMRHLEPDEARIREEFARGTPSYGRLFALFHAHHAERSGKARWGDKSLHTEHYADRVFGEYPAARVLHMVRDPRDRYASVRRRHEGERAHVGNATGRWWSSTRAGRRNQSRHPDRYLLVRYEDLVSDPDATMRRVCAFVALDYDPEMLTMRGAPEHLDRGGNNSSFGDLETARISTRAVGRYREVLSPSELMFIQLVAGREMRAVGYDLAPEDHAPLTRARGYAAVPAEAVRLGAWIVSDWRRRRRGVPVSAPKHRDRR